MTDEFQQLISDVCKVPVNQIQEQSSLRDDLGIDSLQMVNLIVELAQRFGLEISTIKSFNEVRTVGNLYQLLVMEGNQ